MSSNAYADKSLEELRPIVEKYFENYQRHFGDKAKVEELTSKLTELRIQRERQLFESMFSHLTPKNIQDCIDLIKRLNNDRAEESKVSKRKNKQN